MARRVGLLLAALLSWPAPCVAQPTIWQRTENPDTQRAYDLLTVVEQKLEQSVGPFDLLELHRSYGEIVALLEGNQALSLPDPRLWYLVADVYSNSSVGRYRDARRAVEQALAAAPESPSADRGWFLLGLACDKLGDTDCSNRAYTRALGRAYDRNFRANIFLNRGESNMGLGELEMALADARQAVRLATRMDLLSLAYYDLGIALERSGDLPQALVAMRRARANWPALAPFSALDQPDVFFVPSFEIYYYKALEKMALAQLFARDHDYEQEQRYLRGAIDNWTDYLAAAEPEGHEYVSNAKLHRKACVRDLNRSMARAASHRSEPRSR